MDIIPLKQPRRPFPVPDVMQVMVETFGLDYAPAWTEIGYTLTRRKEGTEIGLRHGKHWWSLSALVDVYPPGFAAARKWIHDYAAQHGQTAHELRWDRKTHQYVRL
jgi:hypothetical protein